MRSFDTTPEADQVRLRLLRAAGQQRRLGMACAMADGSRQMTMAGIRARHPDYTPADVELALRRVLLGDELFRLAWPDSPLRNT